MSNTQDTQRFTMTAEHIALLSAGCVYWERSDCGAPGIDPKRPYGNSDLHRDVAQLLGIALEVADEWEGPIPSVAQQKHLEKIHRETETALQIVLATQSFEPGEYETPRYTNKWRRVTTEG
jgi:hypothetical protein